ncbi:VOC family protein [Streptomyces sp. NPDC005507]|uniref:VOC family protein n=1 Tax=Streptomyces sp. NPDC005507 TaxID=3154885 RepID=UPI0033A8DBB4
MTFSLTSLIVDAADLESESSFWHRLLGGSITRTTTHHFLQLDGFPVIVIQHAPGQVPPQWPGGATQQMHFDLVLLRGSSWRDVGQVAASLSGAAS